MDQQALNEAEARRVTSAVREARARILWGEPVSAVLDSMMEAGVDGAFAQSVVTAAMKERGAEIRKSGIRELVLGGGILILGAVLFVVVIFSGMIFIVPVGGSITLALYGGYRMVRGLLRLIAGPRAAIDVSDL